MFSINEMKTMGEQGQDKKGKYKNKTPPNIYSNTYMSPFVESKGDNEINTQMIDRILENEKQTNKLETWNKLNKTVKIQKLNTFAEKYCAENKLDTREIQTMKHFFMGCLEKNKLQKAKDLVYDKETQEIVTIPSLIFHTETHNFTLKNLDKQRVSTLKSLTPKKKILEISADVDCPEIP
jgi:CRISPR/Cas system CMR-associated protein Cmr5 small subunit